MAGGLAVAANLLCVVWSGARGRVFLFDLEEGRPMSMWDLTPPGEGYSDAGGVALERDFVIHVADTVNDRVRRFTAFGRPLEPLGRVVDRGPGARARDQRGVLDRPHGVAVWNDEVLVACGDSPLRRGVQRFGRDGSHRGTLPAYGDPQRKWGAPRGLFAGPRGIFVADTLHGVVQHFRPEGAFMAAWRTAQDEEERSRPVAVAARADGSFLVLDGGDRPGVKEFGADGHFRGCPQGCTDGLEGPVDLTIGAGDALYVLDHDGERVSRFGADLRPEGVVVDLQETLDG